MKTTVDVFMRCFFKPGCAGSSIAPASFESVIREIIPAIKGDLGELLLWERLSYCRSEPVLAIACGNEDYLAVSLVLKPLSFRIVVVTVIKAYISYIQVYGRAV